MNQRLMVKEVLVELSSTRVEDKSRKSRSFNEVQGKQVVSELTKPQTVAQWNEMLKMDQTTKII